MTRRERLNLILTIGIFLPTPNPVDQHNVFVIINNVDNSPRAYTNPIALLPEFLNSVGAGIPCQRSDSDIHPPKVSGRKSVQITLSVWGQPDFIISPIVQIAGPGTHYTRQFRRFRWLRSPLLPFGLH